MDHDVRARRPLRSLRSFEKRNGDISTALGSGTKKRVVDGGSLGAHEVCESTSGSGANAFSNLGWHPPVEKAPVGGNMGTDGSRLSPHFPPCKERQGGHPQPW